MSQVKEFKGKNYRLIVDNLEHDIVPEKSKVIVKANKIILKLGKVKGEFSYDHWTELTSKKSKEEKQKLKSDPTSGIMDMMKVCCLDSMFARLTNLCVFSDSCTENV